MSAVPAMIGLGPDRPRLIAFYLPQFHPIPENDEWWGAGFTEWSHVAQARPLFRGHHQPHLPGELGFYDLRLPETRAAQAELARHHGISAFCYWHYWFAGRRILERPFDEVLRSGEPRFPFCLGWANQDWYGNPYRLLIEQTYPGLQDHTAHFSTLLKAFSDDRYLTVDGKPLLYFYKPSLLPDSKRVTDHWRELAHRAGLRGLHLVGEALPSWTPTDYGFDAVVTIALPRRLDDLAWQRPWRTLRSLHRRLRNRPTIYSYSKILRTLLAESRSGALSYQCVIPNWDNTPRWGVDGMVLRDSTPEHFRRHVRQALERAVAAPPAARLVFIKSWNEWAEGNYLEPDREFGRAHLRVLAEELERLWPAGTVSRPEFGRNGAVNAAAPAHKAVEQRPWL